MGAWTPRQIAQANGYVREWTGGRAQHLPSKRRGTINAVCVRCPPGEDCYVPRVQLAWDDGKRPTWVDTAKVRPI